MAPTEPTREYTVFFGKLSENHELGTGYTVFFRKLNENHELGTVFLHKRIISAVQKVEFVSDRIIYNTERSLVSLSLF
jgi:hypothetical protein